jgi:hypothetical protein
MNTTTDTLKGSEALEKAGRGHPRAGAGRRRLAPLRQFGGPTAED